MECYNLVNYNLLCFIIRSQLFKPTPKIAEGIAPPPAENIPGCGRPFGGNSFNGGGAKEASNIIPIAIFSSL